MRTELFSVQEPSPEILLFEDAPYRAVNPLETPTAEKTYLARLREERDKYHLILENIADGVLVLDEHFRFLHLNSSAVTILGMERQTLLGKPMAEYCPEISSSSLLRESAFYRAEEISFKNRMTGDTKTLSVYLAPLIVDDASCLNYAITMRDITREKEANDMKSQFVSNVSHELRTPLSCIKGFASTLLRRKGLSDEQKTQFIEIIDKESDRLSRLIEDLLSLSRMEAGSFKLRLSRFSLTELAVELSREFQTQFESKSMSLETDILDGTPDLMADRDKIHQILMNLISNSWKFSPDGTTVRLSARWDNISRCFRITVRDSGRGIAPENVSKLFTKFFREEDRVHTISGTGLGLSIVKTIAERHGGSVAVQSEINKGTAFTIILPLIQDIPA